MLMAKIPNLKMKVDFDRTIYYQTILRFEKIIRDTNVILLSNTND